MPSDSFPLRPYKRCQFSTQLPVTYHYHPSHFWMARESEEGLWRIGFTKFATRMLGEIVDHAFDTPPGTPVVPGQIIGWIEGFKALTELYSIATGTFAGGNPALADDITLISRDPYHQGWLYQVTGELDPHAVDVEGYCAILDTTIEHLQEDR